MNGNASRITLLLPIVAHLAKCCTYPIVLPYIAKSIYPYLMLGIATVKMENSLPSSLARTEEEQSRWQQMERTAVNLCFHCSCLCLYILHNIIQGL